MFQRTDRPGSLLAILQEFAARAINLTKLESPAHQEGPRRLLLHHRPRGAHQPTSWWPTACATCAPRSSDIKFLGCYPAAGEHGPAVRRDAEEAWRAADAWIKDQKAKLVT